MERCRLEEPPLMVVDPDAGAGDHEVEHLAACWADVRTALPARENMEAGNGE
jgi:hypothetical protein